MNLYMMYMKFEAFHGQYSALFTSQILFGHSTIHTLSDSTKIFKVNSSSLRRPPAAVLSCPVLKLKIFHSFFRPTNDLKVSR